MKRNSIHSELGSRRSERADGAALPPCQLSFGEVAKLRTATIGNSVVRAEILLDKGANVRQFWHLPTGARSLAEKDDWLRQLQRFHRGGCRRNSYDECYEGGWQDVLPARMQVDGGGASDGEIIGEAAVVPWEVTRSLLTPDAAQIVCSARLPQSGLEVVKRFRLRRGVASLRVETTVRNARRRSVRFSWTQHPALGGDLLDDTSKVLLPGGKLRMRRGNHSHAGDGALFGNCTRRLWSRADALLPPPGTADRFFTFSNVDSGSAVLASELRGVAVRLRWDTQVFPHAWLWCARGPRICCVAVEPSTTCLPDLTSSAALRMLRFLQPGQSIKTWVELSVIELNVNGDGHQSHRSAASLAPLPAAPSLFGSGWS